MAKKSARSKGFRNPKKRSNAYTLPEKRALIFSVSILAAILFCAVAVPRIVDAVLYLDVRDGVVQGVEDDWLIKNFSETDKPRYRKVAEVSPAQGYVFDRAEASPVDKQENYLYYRAEDSSVPLQEYYAFAGNSSYDELARDSLDTIQNFVDEVIYAGEVVSGEYEEVKYCSYVLEYSDNNAADNQAAQMEYIQMVNVYVQSPMKDTCVILSSTIVGGDISVFADRGALLDSLVAAIPSIELSK